MDGLMSKILIAEDDMDSRDALAGLLRFAGYEVVCASNGREAFRVAFQDQPDLVVLDLAMPGVDGAFFLQTVRSYLRFATLPVIVWTGYPDGRLADAVRALNVRNIITKGQSTFEELLTAIRNALDGMEKKEN